MDALACDWYMEIVALVAHCPIMQFAILVEIAVLSPFLPIPIHQSTVHANTGIVYIQAMGTLIPTQSISLHFHETPKKSQKPPFPI